MSHFIFRLLTLSFSSWQGYRIMPCPSGGFLVTPRRLNLKSYNLQYNSLVCWYVSYCRLSNFYTVLLFQITSLIGLHSLQLKFREEVFIKWSMKLLTLLHEFDFSLSRQLLACNGQLIWILAKYILTYTVTASKTQV